MNAYIYLGRLISEKEQEKLFAKSDIEYHKELPLTERIKDNFSNKIWKARFDYYIIYAFTKNLL